MIDAMNSTLKNKTKMELEKVPSLEFLGSNDY